MGLEHHANSGTGVDPEHDLAGFRPAAADVDEPDAGWVLEQQPQLGLPDRQALAGADEERDAGPAPVVDAQHQRGGGLGIRVRGHAVDLPVALVLASHVPIRVGVLRGPEYGQLGVFESLRVRGRRGLHGCGGQELEQVVDHHVA